MPAPELKLTVRTVTPVYLAGAEHGLPELRAPSFKGLLRFWYRAFDPDFLDHEPLLFGGAGGTHGQSPFLLRVGASGPPRRWTWNQAAVGRFDEGQGRNTKNGIRYLANRALSDRRAIAPGAACTMHVLCLRRAPAPEWRRALLGSLWLLFHLGGAGSRSRRGFGSFSLERWGVPRPVAGDRSSAAAGRLQGRGRGPVVAAPRSADAAITCMARMVG